MRAKGVEVVIAEVSAHAIYLEKLGDIKADIAVLTNITQDHLDYFKDFSAYRGVKMSFLKTAVQSAQSSTSTTKAVEFCLTGWKTERISKRSVTDFIIPPIALQST